MQLCSCRQYKKTLNGIKKNAKRLNILWLKVLSSTPIALEKGQKVQKVQQIHRKKCDTKISKLSKVHGQKWTLYARVCHKNKSRNGILLPKLFLPSVRKIALVIKKKIWNSRLKAENLQNFWYHQNNLLERWKVRTIFETKWFFQFVLWGFLELLKTRTIRIQIEKTNNWELKTLRKS